jgi:hypothetical protein
MNPSLCIFLQSSVTSSLSGPVIFLRTSFPIIPNLYSYHRVTPSFTLV